MRLQHIRRRRRENEVTEAAVQVFVQVEMVERVDKVRPIEMSIHAEHLTEDGLANVHKLLREPTAFADPVARASEIC